VDTSTAVDSFILPTPSETIFTRGKDLLAELYGEDSDGGSGSCIVA
jgi:hypothetical protein